MKIIVVGLGEAGRALIRAIDTSKHEITVIDKDSRCVDSITDRYPVNGFAGSGASTETLLRAGADKADVLVALTHTDEINLLSCMQAKTVGTKACVARLLMPDLVREAERLKNQYKIDFFVNPRTDLAEEIHKNLGLPGYIKLESVYDDSYVIDLNAVGNSPLIGKSIAQIREEIHGGMVIGTVLRGNKKHIPKDSLVIRESDTLDIAVTENQLEEVLKALNVKRSPVNKAVIVGGGITAVYLAEKLIKDKRSLTILDDDLNRCRELMDMFPSANVACAQGDITEVLEEEQVGKADAIISLTDNDETNLVISMYAWTNGIPSVITCVDKQVHVKLLHKVNIDITVSPTELTVSRVLRFIGER